MTATAAVLTRAALEAWLASLPPDAIAGYPESNDDCPLARFLRQAGHETAVMWGFDWSEDPGGPGAPLVFHRVEQWVVDFVDALDSTCDAGRDPETGTREGYPITAAEALRVLAEVVPPQEVMP